MRTRTATFALIALTALLASLAGCVPGVQGTSPTSPLDVDFTDPANVAEVIAGNQYFVTDTSFYADPEYFGYTTAEANDLLEADLRRVGQTVRKNVSREFTLREVRAPDGWEVGLYRVDATRVVTDRDLDHGVVYIEDNIQFVFSVRIPAETPAGMNVVRIIVEGKDSTTDTIALVFRVAQPQS